MTVMHASHVQARLPAASVASPTSAFFFARVTVVMVLPHSHRNAETTIMGGRMATRSSLGAEKELRAPPLDQREERGAGPGSSF